MNELVKKLIGAMGLREYQKEALLEIEKTFDLPRETKGPFDFLNGSNVDLATGTGKTFLLFATTLIAIHRNQQNVVILTPGLIIKKGIENEFIRLMKDEKISNILNEEGLAFDLCDANDSVIDGTNQVFISNIHASYEKTTSSFTFEKESFTKQKTVILMDEVHHSIEDKNSVALVNNWIKAISPSAVFGFTGTPYKNNTLIPNISYSYKIFDALEEGYVKQISYVTNDSKTAFNHLWEKVFKNHKDIIKKVSPIKPITLIVTNTINNMPIIFKDLVAAGVPPELILEVSSSSKHKGNIPHLETIDNVTNKFQFIISVSMLTEGWDSKNVFQIIPHEERAFNSKLLISQVLGRGLRTPFPRYDKRNDLLVYNHSNWSDNVEMLVKGLVEGDAKLETSTTLEKSVPLIFEKITKVSSLKVTSEKMIKVPKEFAFAPQEKVKTEHTYFVNSKNEIKGVEYKVNEELLDLDIAVKKIFRILKNININYSFNNLKADVIKSLKNDKYISKRNQNIYIKSFSKVMSNKIGDTLSVKEKIEYVEQEFNPKESSIFFRSLNNKDLTLIYNEGILPGESSNKIEEVIEKNRFFSSSFYRVNKSKTNAFLASLPEKKFVKALETSTNIDWYLKISDQGDFSITYTELVPGSKREYITRNFNPDFLISFKGELKIVETKDTRDLSHTNYRKMVGKNEYIKTSGSGIPFMLASEEDFVDIVNGENNTTFEKRLKEKYG